MFCRSLGQLPLVGPADTEVRVRILGFTVGRFASNDMAYNRALIANRHLISAL